jgi:hypothetical protein
MKDVGLKSLLAWSDPTRGFDNEDFTEALAGVLMLLLGRTVVVTGDTLLTALQDGAEEGCHEVAEKLKSDHADVARLGIPPELIDIAVDSLEVGGRVLGPLPPDTRARVRRLLYQVFEPIPPGQERDFLDRLGDDFFIPKEADLRALTDELTAIAQERFVLFAREFVGRIGNYILELLEEFITAVVDMIVNWERTLANALTELAASLRGLEQRLVALNREVSGFFIEATDALDAFLSLLAGPDLQSKVKSEVKSKFVDKALDELERNDVYKVLPGGVRSSVRGLVGSAVNAAMQNPVIDPVFGAVRAVAGQVHVLLPDVRELDPEENLPEQLMELVLDRIEQRLRAHFGGGKPGISLNIDYTYSVWMLDDIFGNGHWETRHIYISLGRVEVNLNPFIDVVRAAISSVDYYHDALDQACLKLADAMAKELELAATQFEADKKKVRKDKLQRISNEHNNDPREIAILAPVNLEHFTSDIDCRIHLGGVPVSYLGLGEGEASRVLIYVNSHLIPVKSLVVEESLSVVDGERHKGDIDFETIANSVVGDVPGGATRNSFMNARVRIVADTAASLPKQKSNKAALERTTSFVFTNGALTEQPAAKRAYAPRPETSPAKIALRRSYRSDNKGRPVHTYGFENLRPGGLKPASVMQDVLADRLPGMLIQFKVAPDEPFIAEGVNVLTVVVIERGGHRHQQSVTFTVGMPVEPRKPRSPTLDIPLFKDPSEKLSINNVARARIDAAEGIASGEIRDEMVKRVHKARAKPPVVAAGRTVEVQQPAVRTRLRKELLTVRDKAGREVGRHELEYRTAAQRTKQLRALGIDTTRLAAEGKRIETERVTYRTVQAAPSGTKTFAARPGLDLTEAGVKEQMSASLAYLAAQHELNLKDFAPSESSS